MVRTRSTRPNNNNFLSFMIQSPLMLTGMEHLAFERFLYAKIYQPSAERSINGIIYSPPQDTLAISSPHPRRQGPSRIQHALPP